MTANEWRDHAAQCRQVAMTIDDRVARNVLLEAADDYLAMAARESDLLDLGIPAYQAAAVNPKPGVRARH